MKINTMAEMQAAGKTPEVLYWVGCAGSFDARAQKVAKSFVKIMQSAGIEFAILGNEESCTGDPARRAGNEFIFQMLALQNIQTLNMYNVKSIVTACPHCFNTLSNEYPALGGDYNVVHHSVYLNKLLKEGRISIAGGAFAGKKITYHDPCYLGRVNGVYEAPRDLMKALDVELVEMKRCKANGLCCGAGGAQMYKEDEPGDKRINIERTEEIVQTGAEAVVIGCPFCLTMVTDGIKSKEKQDDIMIYDLTEMVVQANQL